MINYQPTEDDYIIILNDQELVVNHELGWQLSTIEEIGHKLSHEVDYIRVGEFQSRYCYVTEFNDSSIIETVTLRSQISLISEYEYQLASRALQLITWKNQHQYCGQCGRKTTINIDEHALQCKPCNLFFYPRISPCIMCLITKGEYCLLANHSKHADGFYATLAGFVEAGESLEHAVHREVQEEVALNVKNVRYFGSQSWPFPHQLMVGYTAEYESGEIVVDGDEINTADWFHYSDLPKRPDSATLSGQLIDSFVSQFIGD